MLWHVRRPSAECDVFFVSAPAQAVGKPGLVDIRRAEATFFMEVCSSVMQPPNFLPVGLKRVFSYWNSFRAGTLCSAVSGPARFEPRLSSAANGEEDEGTYVSSRANSACRRTPSFAKMLCTWVRTVATETSCCSATSAGVTFLASAAATRRSAGVRPNSAPSRCDSVLDRTARSETQTQARQRPSASPEAEEALRGQALISQIPAGRASRASCPCGRAPVQRPMIRSKTGRVALSVAVSRPLCRAKPSRLLRMDRP